MRRSLRLSLPSRLRPTNSAPSPAVSLLIARQYPNKIAARLIPLAGLFQYTARRWMATETAEVTETAGPYTHAALSESNNCVLLFRQGKTKQRYDNLWLRDSCSCPQCLDPDSGQKTFSTTDLPDFPEVKSANIDGEGNLIIVWQNDPLSNGQEHTTTVTVDELRRFEKVNPQPRIQLQPPPQKTFWDKAYYEKLRQEGKCTVSYQDWMTNDEAFWEAFSNLTKTGLLFVQGVPEDEKEVQKVANRIGMIQNTFYGDTWDVKSKPNAENVAYTNVFLGLHQDLMYHVPIPRLQLLHCIANSAEGGESIFSDGFRAIAEMRRFHFDEYENLCQKLVYFGYEKNGNHYQRAHCTISLNRAEKPIAIHWAPPFQTTFRGHVPQQWKDAATIFKKNIEDPENVVEVKMKAGECVIFDNWRVLHGRKEFAVGGSGTRWLKGTYISPQVYQAKETALVRRLLGDKPWPAHSFSASVKTWIDEQNDWASRKGWPNVSKLQDTNARLKYGLDAHGFFDQSGIL